MPTSAPPFRQDDSSISDSPPDSTDPSQFPPTRWSMIARVGSADPSESDQALSVLCERYWLPLYAFARRNGLAPADAEDVTQEYFYQLLSRDTLQTADSDKGRLRTFLMGGLKKHMISHYRRATSERRGGKDRVVNHVSLDEAERLLDEDRKAYSGGQVSADAVFERQWALALLDRVLKRVEEKFREKGEQAVFEELRHFLQPTGGRNLSFDEAAEALGVTNNCVKVRVHRLRKLYQKCLREEIAATVEDPADVASEMQHLIAIFS